MVREEKSFRCYRMPRRAWCVYFRPVYFYRHVFVVGTNGEKDRELGRANDFSLHRKESSSDGNKRYYSFASLLGCFLGENASIKNPIKTTEAIDGEGERQREETNGLSIFSSPRKTQRLLLSRKQITLFLITQMASDDRDAISDNFSSVSLKFIGL
jgi:hypothetical protein